MGNFDFSKYCTPAQLYLVLGAIGIIGTLFKNYGIWTLLTQALFLVIWTWVLNWLCSKGFKAISWILVLLPFIMGLFAYFFTKDVATESFDDEGFVGGKDYIAKEQEKERRKQLCNGCKKIGQGKKGPEYPKRRADCRAQYCN